MKHQIETRPLKSLRPNPLNPRTIDPSDPEILALADSIKAQGLLQPLVITPDGLIVAGHRRHVACKRAGLTEVPCLVKKLDETGQIEAMLAENLARQELNPFDIGVLCGKLRAKKLTPAEIAARVGLTKQTVTKYLHVADLPAELQQSVASYDLTLSHVEALAKLPDQDQQLALGRRAAAENWLAWELEDKVREHTDAPARTPLRERAPRVVSPRSREKVLAMQRKAPRERVIDLLSEATTLLNREAALYRDNEIRTWLNRMVDGARRAA